METAVLWIRKRKEKKDVRKIKEEWQADHCIDIKPTGGTVYGKFFCFNSVCGRRDFIF